MLNEWLHRQAAELQVELTGGALLQLERYAALLQEWNQSLNLTTISETPEIYELHFLDSLSVALAVDMTQAHNLIDVGTGAGFPGLVLAIAFPATRVTLVESVNKKACFLQAVVAELDLADQVQVVCERAEIIGQQVAYRQQFDLAVARAVARLAVLAEYCLPLVRVGGCFVAQKGPEIEAELAEASRCFALLGGAAVHVDNWLLPSGAGRTIVRVNKRDNSPDQFPRRPGMPSKRPLL